MNTRDLHHKLSAMALAVGVLSLSAQVHAGDPVRRLLDLQLKKGIITQQEYNELLAEMDEPTAAAPAPAPAARNEAAEIKDFIKAQDNDKVVKFVEKHEKDGSVKPSGLGWTSADGKNEINLTGRLHVDARVINNAEFGDSLDRDAGMMSDRFTMRRARIGVNGIFNKDIAYEVQLNGISSTANVVDTAWAAYKLDPAMQFRMGRFNQPFALETQTSANNIDFMERSYLHQMAPFKQLGAMLNGEKGIFTYAVSGYQRDFDPQNNFNGLGPEAAARLTANLASAFGASDKTVLHIGAAATTGRQTVTPTTATQTGSSSTTYETRAPIVSFTDENLGLSNVYRNRIYGAPPCGTQLAGAVCTTGGYGLPASEVAKVDRSLKGLELAAAYGPAKLQAEWAQIDASASSNAITSGGVAYTSAMSGNAKASYVEFMYNLTGENWADAYKSGVFSSIKPNSPFSFTNRSGLGAWQIGLRYSVYDASGFGDNSCTATTTAGANAICNYIDGQIVTSTGTTAGTKQYQIQGSPKGNTVTLGVNWLLNPNARIMFNYSRTSFDRSFLPVDIGTLRSNSKVGQGLDVFSVRTQFNF